MRGVKVWLVRVSDGNGDSLDLYGPFLSQQELEAWMKPRVEMYPELGFEVELVTPKDMKWKHPHEIPYEGVDGPKCEDCGSLLTDRDFFDYVEIGGAPEGSIPRCCTPCAEKLED
jgi:hypothetical protein